MSVMDHLRRICRRKEETVQRDLEKRIEIIESRLTAMAGAEQCGECGGPVPYRWARIPFAQLHVDGRVEILDPRCCECGQLTDEDGRGLGQPSGPEGGLLQMVLFGDMCDCDECRDVPVPETGPRMYACQRWRSKAGSSDSAPMAAAVAVATEAAQP